MSYVDPFHCRQMVGNEMFRYVDNPEALIRAVHAELTEAMVAYADQHGFPFFDRRAIKITEGAYRLNIDGVVYMASWCPPADWPCEFLGGPLDGTLKTLAGRKAQMTFPLPIHYTLAQMYERESLDPCVPMAVGYNKVDYRVAGINPVSNRWVYVCAD